MFELIILGIVVVVGVKVISIAQYCATGKRPPRMAYKSKSFRPINLEKLGKNSK
jgi:hypothetical protein